MTHEELKECIGEYRELKKDLWWANRWGVQKIEGYHFGVYYNDFAGHWQFSWNDPENEHRVSDVEDVFDNKEKAEWYMEFGCLERMEQLILPNWEDIEEDLDISFVGKDGELYILHIDKVLDEIRIYSNSGLGYNACADEVSKENYTFACRKCKELFLKGVAND